MASWIITMLISNLAALGTTQTSSLPSLNTTLVHAPIYFHHMTQESTGDPLIYNFFFETAMAGALIIAYAKEKLIRISLYPFFLGTFFQTLTKSFYKHVFVQAFA